jgi:hypothetical protein
MSTDAAASQVYELYVLDGSVRLRMFYRDRGVALTDDGIALWVNGQREDWRFDEIHSVTLTTHSFGTTGHVGQCTILFRNGSKRVVMGSNGKGSATPASIEFYRRFVADFHTRLSASDAGKHISFHSGWTDNKHLTLVILVGVLTLMLTPALFVFFATGELKVLSVLAAGGFLVWPLWMMVARNKPQTYVPQSPPDLVA